MVKNLIQEYISGHKEKQFNELNDFKSITHLKNVVETATLGTNSKGEKLSHQYRLTKKALESAQKQLLKKTDDISNAKSFDELHEIVKLSTQDIKGIGVLYFYDISLRIGAYLNLYPDKVYLHRGSLIGAKNFNIKINKQKIIPKNNFPSEFEKLECFEIENFLCIFKNKLPKPISKC